MATMAHDGQFRKGTDIPYITHPLAVAELTQTYMPDEDVFIAALLHDVLEDVPRDRIGPDDIVHAFGDRVLSLVQSVTEDKIPGEPEKPWRERKEKYLQHLLTEEDEGAIIISVADKLHNIQCTLGDYAVIGDKLWDRFNGDPVSQLWFYRSVAEIAAKKLGKKPLVEQLSEKIEQLDKIINGDRLVA